MEKDIIEHHLNLNRRKFLSRMSLGLGSVALGSLLMPDLFKGNTQMGGELAAAIPDFAPKAKRVIYLFQNGAPSQLESFDYKPK
ncbi:MAG: sulfatase, partial [Cyclobacteriaceae bacterium]